MIQEINKALLVRRMPEFIKERRGQHGLRPISMCNVLGRVADVNAFPRVGHLFRQTAAAPDLVVRHAVPL